MPLADLIQRRFGVKTSTVKSPASTTVGTTVEKKLSVNPNRLAWLIVNLSANIVYLGWDNQVSSSRGIALAPAGGNAVCTPEEDFELPSEEVYLVASGAGSAVFIVEIVEGR